MTGVCQIPNVWRGSVQDALADIKNTAWISSFLESQHYSVKPNQIICGSSPSWGAMQEGIPLLHNSCSSGNQGGGLGEHTTPIAALPGWGALTRDEETQRSEI